MSYTLRPSWTDTWCESPPNLARVSLTSGMEMIDFPSLVFNIDGLLQINNLHNTSAIFITVTQACCCIFLSLQHDNMTIIWNWASWINEESKMICADRHALCCRCDICHTYCCAAIVCLCLAGLVTFSGGLSAGFLWWYYSGEMRSGFTEVSLWLPVPTSGQMTLKCVVYTSTSSDFVLSPNASHTHACLHTTHLYNSHKDHIFGHCIKLFFTNFQV